MIRIFLYTLTVATLLFSTQTAGAQNPDCTDVNTTFKSGELVTYDVVYNWGFIWINAGKVAFKVKSKNYLNRPVYFLDAFGTTLKAYDWIFKVRDHYQSIIDSATFKPMWFSRDTYEDGYTVNNSYVYNYSKKQIFGKTENTDSPRKLDTIALKPCTQDLLSIIYHARNINFSKYQPGEKIPVSLIIDGKIYDLFIRYHGKEEITTRDKKTYMCHKFTALLVEGTIFNAGEDLTVWVTDDKNHIPVLVEAKILVGSVKAVLTGATGLRNPSILK